MADDRASQQAFIDALLDWDYAAMFDRYDAGGGVVDELPSIGHTFGSVQEYKTAFEKMMLEEALAQLMQGSESAELILPQPGVLVSASQSGDTLHARVLMAEEHVAKFSNLDLVVIGKTNPLDEDNENALVDHAIAHCEGKDGSHLRLRFCLREAAHAHAPEAAARVARMRSQLRVPMTGWWVMRLGNLATLAREWAAVQRADFFPFKDVLLSGKLPAPRPEQRLEAPAPLMAHLQGQYNESQLAALTTGLDGRPFVLIQGPPGTGKTQTILGLLSILKSTKRKGTSVSALGSGQNLPSKAGALGTDLTLRMQQWHLSCPWLAAPAGRTCKRHFWGPQRCPDGSSTDTYGLRAANAPIQLSASRPSKARILVCAPSNAAIDEIVLRVLQRGLLDGKAQHFTPSIVRTGVTARMSPQVAEVTLDALVAKELGDGPSDYQESDAPPDYEAYMQREAAAARVLNNADVVFSTLAFTGSASFRKATAPFDAVVIDEAAQALEPSCLVPHSPSVRQVYLVGDPVQLPATVISTRATKANYQQSLFKRLQGAGYPVSVLQVQYRMHPAIASFASNQFYGGRIENGPNVANETAAPYHKLPGLGPLAFYHCSGVESTPEGSTSLVNEVEADMVVALVHCLVAQSAELGTAPHIGVISPYKSQVKLLADKVAAVLPAIAPHVEVNTIDGFQGREKAVIIFSAVRSVRKGKKRIGFVADERRINVGLTRGRGALLLVGNRNQLMQDARWETLLRLCSDTGSLYDAKPLFSTFLSTVIAGKVSPVRLPPKPAVAEAAFFAAPEDDFEAAEPMLPSKRAHQGASSKVGKRQRGRD